MTDVHDWDPTAHALGSEHVDLLNQIAATIADSKLHLTSTQLAALRTIYSTSAHTWVEFVKDRSDNELVDWIKVLTLCPEQYSGFIDGARSPVILLARVLRTRGTYPDSLSSWIKQNSANRFLPYGSLADRLR